MTISPLSNIRAYFDTPWISRELRSRWRRPASYGAMLVVNIALLVVLYYSLPWLSEMGPPPNYGQPAATLGLQAD